MQKEISGSLAACFGFTEQFFYTIIPCPTNETFPYETLLPVDLPSSSSSYSCSYSNRRSQGGRNKIGGRFSRRRRQSERPPYDSRLGADARGGRVFDEGCNRESEHRPRSAWQAGSQ